MFPTLGFVCHGAATEACSAFVSGELEPTSTWAPVIWPFYGAIALGLGAFFLQSIAQCLRHVQSLLGRAPTPLEIRPEGV